MPDSDLDKIDVNSPDFNFDTFFEHFTLDVRKCINTIKESEAKIKTVLLDSSTSKVPMQGASTVRKEVTVRK